jgi:hypothetical protein
MSDVGEMGGKCDEMAPSAFYPNPVFFGGLVLHTTPLLFRHSVSIVTHFLLRSITRQRRSRNAFFETTFSPFPHISSSPLEHTHTKTQNTQRREEGDPRPAICPQPTTQARHGRQNRLLLTGERERERGRFCPRAYVCVRASRSHCLALSPGDAAPTATAGATTATAAAATSRSSRSRNGGLAGGRCGLLRHGGGGGGGTTATGGDGSRHPRRRGEGQGCPDGRGGAAVLCPCAPAFRLRLRLRPPPAHRGGHAAEAEREERARHGGLPPQWARPDESAEGGPRPIVLLLLIFLLLLFLLPLAAVLLLLLPPHAGPHVGVVAVEWQHRRAVPSRAADPEASEKPTQRPACGAEAGAGEWGAVVGAGGLARQPGVDAGCVCGRRIGVVVGWRGGMAWEEEAVGGTHYGRRCSRRGAHRQGRGRRTGRCCTRTRGAPE